MIPTTVENETIKTDFTFVEEREQPTKTYKMLLDVSRVRGYTDKQEAIKQAIFKILQTERYQYKNVYSDNYGVEFWDLYGQSPAYCVPEIERRITEALTWDETASLMTLLHKPSDDFEENGRSGANLRLLNHIPWRIWIL